MNKLLNERGEEQLSTANRFHWLISAEQAGVLSCCELQRLATRAVKIIRTIRGFLENNLFIRQKKKTKTKN